MLFDTTNEDAKPQQTARLCRHSEPALEPYAQLCWLGDDSGDKCADTRRHSRHSDEFTQSPTSPDDASGSRTENDVTGSDVSLTSVVVNCGKNKEMTPTSETSPAPAPSTDGVDAGEEGHAVRELGHELDSAPAVVAISGHSRPITSSRLVGNSHVVTSSMDGSVKVWKGDGTELASMDCSSPVRSMDCFTDSSKSSDRRSSGLLILAGTCSGHVAAWRITVRRDRVKVKQRSQLSINEPNPVSALALSLDQQCVFTGSCYSAFDFVAPTASGKRSGKLSRRTRGTVKRWPLTLWLDDQSDAKLAFTCSRTDRQLTSPMTSEPACGYGVTCLSLCEESALLVVGLSSVTDTALLSSSSSSTWVPAVIAVCKTDNLETVWLAEDLTCFYVYESVVHCQHDAWSVCVATESTVAILRLSEEETNSEPTTGFIYAFSMLLVLRGGGVRRTLIVSCSCEVSEINAVISALCTVALKHLRTALLCSFCTIMQFVFCLFIT